MAILQNGDLIDTHSEFYDELYEELLGLRKEAPNFNEVALEMLKVRHITYKDKFLLFPLLRKDSMEAFLYALNEIKRDTTLSERDILNIPDSFCKTLLHHAVINNDLACAEFLLESGLNIDAQDFLGMTPLHYLNCVDMEMVELLLKYNPNLNIRACPLKWFGPNPQIGKLPIDTTYNEEIKKRLQDHQWLPS